MTDTEFLEKEIEAWKKSPARLEQIAGKDYYEGKHKILAKKRKAIDKDGNLVEIKNLPNNKIVDNQYALHVDRKVNYILGKPFIIATQNKDYENALKTVFNKKFMRTMKRLGKCSLNGAIGWLNPYYDKNGDFRFKVFPAYECLPFWADSEHTILDKLARLYSVEVYDGKVKKTIEKVEVYTENGIERYVLQNGRLIADVENPSSAYFEIDGVPMNWERIPVIPFKYNDAEKPLLRDCKELQDGINLILSIFEDNMESNPLNTILVLTNYDGQNLGEFRQNLATYSAVKVRSDSGGKGGVETLEIEVNSENYKAILDIFKKKLIENARSFDAKDDRIGSNANQMNLQSMYSDIDLDANGMETEYQASFEELLFFVNAYLSHKGKGDFENETVEIKFDRDMMMNESEKINSIKASVGLVSDKTLLAEHPYVTNPELELKEMQKQAEEALQKQMDYMTKIKTGEGEGNEE